MLLVALFCVGCTSSDWKNHDPEYQLTHDVLNETEFQKANYPLRTLRVAVVAREWVGDEFVRGTFQETSQLLEAQVGIRLEVTIFHEPAWTTRSLFRMHHVLKQFRVAHPEFDIVAGISLNSMEDEKQWWCDNEGGVCTIGMVNEWRNVALLTLYPTLIVHEIGHMFTESPWHSPIGALRSPAQTPYFSIADRERILSNKWKDFKRQPWFLETCLGFC